MKTGKQLGMFLDQTKRQEIKVGPEVDPRDLLLRRLDAMDRKLDIALFVLNAGKQKSRGENR